jgi:hypothetical protein
MAMAKAEVLEEIGSCGVVAVIRASASRLAQKFVGRGFEQGKEGRSR